MDEPDLKGAVLSDFGDERFCVECCEKLTALQAWPFSKVNVDQWLSNFEEVDKPFARHMVSHFVYFNDQMIDAQFISAFQQISNQIHDGWQNRPDADANWNNFLNRCLVVPVQGEEPNPADSGYTFARKARQVLRISEDQLADLDDAIFAMRSSPDLPIVFVDDFVGSGEQFLTTLRRPSRAARTLGLSISRLLANKKANVFYCNVAMTEKGSKRIGSNFPSIKLSTASLIGPEYSWTSPDGGMWPEAQRNDGISVIEKYSKKLGYKDDNGSQDDWRGFHCLGLGLAFEHSTPDASLPIFFSERGGWKPLVVRR